jgi:hypothetical protein
LGYPPPVIMSLSGLLRTGNMKQRLGITSS